jgi:hypothetical protein
MRGIREAYRIGRGGAKPFFGKLLLRSHVDNPTVSCALAGTTTCSCGLEKGGYEEMDRFGPITRYIDLALR